MGIFNRPQKLEERAQDIRSRTSPGGGTGVGVIPPARSDLSLSDETVMSLGTVYRCVSIIANTIAQLPLSVYRGEEELEGVVLANRPDINLPGNDFWSSTASSLALTGNAYWYVTRNQSGDVKNLEVLNPRNVIVNQDPNKIGAPITYDYGGSRLRKPNISHIRLMKLPHNPKGLGPLQAARGDIENALRLREYSNSFLSHGAIPTGVLSSDQFLNSEQADAYRSAWTEAQASRGLAVLGAGLSYSPISLSPEDLQFLENQHFNQLQIARLFGIPSIFLSIGIEGSSLTYATTESMALLFLQTTLSEYLVSIEEAFTALLPRGQVAKFKLESLLRSDLATRIAAYEKLIDKQVLTPQEVRLMEGYSPEVRGEFFAPTPLMQPKENSNDEQL